MRNGNNGNRQKTIAHQEEVTSQLLAAIERALMEHDVHLTEQARNAVGIAISDLVVEKPPGRTRPQEFLFNVLTTNGPLLQKTVRERGIAAGFSYDQLRRARIAIGAVSYKSRGGNLDSPWVWAMYEHS